MNAPAPPDPIIDAFAEARFEAIEQFAEKQISLWVSVREAAWRGERETLEVHCHKIRFLTRATFDAVRMLGAERGDPGGGA